MINQRTGVLTLRDSLNYEETPIGDDGEFSGVYVTFCLSKENKNKSENNDDNNNNNYMYFGNGIME